MNRNTIYKMDHRQYNSETQETETWIAFTHHSSLIRKVTDLFQHINLHIAFWAKNMPSDMLKPTKESLDYIQVLGFINFKLMCQTCRNCIQARQTSEDEDLQLYVNIKTNNPKSAYYLHIDMNGIPYIIPWN